MCGIVGYVGDRDISSVLIVGLERLSYRGYDSAGIAVLSEDEISVWKKPGKVHVLAKQLEQLNIQSNVGIGHTRWATHGIPNEVNSHPHFDAKKRFAIVHNGIVENYLALKSELIEDGFNGFLVKPNDIEGLKKAVKSISEIKRKNCREWFEEKATNEVFAKRVENWLNKGLSQVAQQSTESN